MLPRREVPTVYWQAIVAHISVILQQGVDVALADSTVAGPTARRDNVTYWQAKANTPLSVTSLLNVP